MPGRVVAASLAVLTLITLARPVAAPAVPVPAGSAAADGPELRVCADPNNLPFSNQQQQGFENAIAAVIAEALHAELTYTWWAERRGFIRNTLNAGRCDLIAGVPAKLERLRTTTPYYRSSYVFATRREDGLDIASLDDPQLARLKVGVQIVGDDGANTPPVHALNRRGIVDNLRGYSLYGDYGRPDPAAAIMDALKRGEIDIAVVWGPLAGYYARRHPNLIAMHPVSPSLDPPGLPMTFAIAMGVRKGDDALYRDVEAALTSQRHRIESILDRFGVPRVDAVVEAAH
jgi:mxaJ protein